MYAALLGVYIQHFGLAVGQFGTIMQHLFSRQQCGHYRTYIECLSRFRLAYGRAEITHCRHRDLIDRQYLRRKHIAVGGTDFDILEELLEFLPVGLFLRRKLLRCRKYPVERDFFYLHFSAPFLVLRFPLGGSIMVSAAALRFISYLE